MARYTIVAARSGLTARARSSLHPIQAETGQLAGEIHAEMADGRVDTGLPASAHVELAVGSLRADNPLVNREIQNRLDARRFPTVTAEISSVTGPRADGEYDLEGELTLRRVTRPVTARAVLVASDDRTLEVTGELTLDVRDFQLDPPKLFGLRVHPDVAVTVRIVATAEHDPTRRS